MGHWSCVTGMPADGGANSGWDQHSYVEMTGILRLALAKFQRHAGRNLMRVSVSLVGGSLAIVEFLVRLSDHQPDQLLPGRKFLLGLMGQPFKNAAAIGRARQLKINFGNTHWL